MKKEDRDSAWRADCLAAVKSQADWVAEAMMTHTDCCKTGVLASMLVREAGLTEAGFLMSWLAGAYDGE